MQTRRQLLQAATAAAATALCGSAAAQATGNAFIISGFPAGGMGDFVARPLADKLRGKYAPNVLVESRTGAGGRIAVEYVKRAAPDGLTILQIPSSPMVLYPNTYKKLNYDPLADFIPVGTTVTYAFSTPPARACRPRSRPWPTTSSGPRPIPGWPITACRPPAPRCTSSA